MKKVILAVCLGLMTPAAMAQTLTFGVAPTFPPFESVATDGSLKGFDIDLGNAICAHLKRDCKWVNTSFDGIIPALKARKFDAILSAMYVNSARLKQIDFTHKLYSIGSYLVAKKTSPLDASKLSTLKGKLIGVESGSAQEEYVKVHWQNKGVDVHSYKDVAQVYLDLQNGRLDGAVLSGVSADLSFLSQPRGQAFAMKGKPLEDQKIFGVGSAIGVRKADNQLKAQLNQAIAQMRQDGTYQKIAQKYFSFDIYGSTP
ncbi:transporter substrate-binding domain-containing protein [Celerinatantimonas diazotrophica]|uniref:Amino acid ABC transporter substrate-binding protein (PAAT family) n=1 Tax=Celerinatantimonas diazotrophica TaxID=412034 RepID=A0A4R1K1F9_9GAMM|nr:transporter substrate-binding domain-containing protein [Celerinatantimonas diazotrophica]TCK57814.1 amino acid ABC transporter substrate-binding protein (PAAT family) [Celerinatantimonas diazotrophica]CAG9298122.1 Lysine/arginine/ornithine-binding periplasmic protein [Celerinatantimonas diazotrophica]